MSAPAIERPASATPRRRRRASRRPLSVLTAWTVRRALVVLIACAGVGVLLYPAGARWYSDRAHASTVGGYVDTVKAMLPADVENLLAEARTYNKHLPTGRIKDPYGSGAGGEKSEGPYADYLRTLDVGPDGMIGYVASPAISMSLPIYHGTAATTLDRGAGHLYGTALPVGGAGTHSVLTAHSGAVGSTLFTHIRDLKFGDLFTVTVLDRTLTYRVDQIKIVLPDQTDDLQPVAGQDFVTLVTCTPIGVNSHRLLVRGVRVHDDDAAARQRTVGAGPARAGFPWWLLEAGGALLVILILTTPLGRTERDLRSPSRAAGRAGARSRRRR
jgi:sortase A